MSTGNDFISTHRPFTGLGMSSLVLGTIALILFFLPILGIPISVLGLAFGLAGFWIGLFRPKVSLRWSLGGIGMSVLALLVNIGIVFAPAGYIPTGQRHPPPWRAPPDRPYVPPPANP
jgi:hypothetical protein